MRRKLLFIAMAMIFGICLSYYASGRIFYLCIMAIFLLALYLASKKMLQKALICSFCFGLVWLQIAAFQIEQGNLSRLYQSMEESVRIKGTVVQIERKTAEQFQFCLQVDGEKLLCSYYQAIDNPWHLLGQELQFMGRVERPQKAGNPRTFDYQLYLKSQGIGYTAVIEDFVVTTKQASLWNRWKRKIIEKREAFFYNLSCRESSEAFLRGILFGDTHDLDEDIYDAFRKNGTAHVLAVSGLHVGMLYGVYRKVKERWNHWLYTAVFLLLLLVYGTATLWSVSVTRAIFLILIMLGGDYLERRYDLLTALASVIIFLVIRNPYVIFGASFQMSFLAVLSMVFFSEPLERIVGRKMAAALAVQIGFLPYMAYVFNYVSLVGILCNLPVVFLISILVPLGVAGFVFYLCSGRVLPLFSELLDGLSNLTVWVNQGFAAEGIFSFDVVSPPLWLVVLVYGLLFYLTSEYAVVYFGRRQWKQALLPLGLVFVCVIFALSIGMTPFDRASLVFVDVGQGDCLHIKTDTGRNILVDGGGNINYNVGVKTLKPYLLKNGVSMVDLVAATHLHTDHYLGLEQLTTCFDVGKILTSGREGQKILLGEDQWMEILWPLTYDADAEDENLNSLIFMVHQKGVKALVTGDITAEGEQMLVEYYRGTDKLQADILKIAHHGSAYSTSDAFLDAVNPQIAVISVGRNNYGHPSEIVIEKLEKRGIMMFRTDLDGAVGIMNRKGKISVCTENKR